MSFWQVLGGKLKRKYINALDIQVLDVANRFKRKNLEYVLQEIGTGSAQSVENLEHRVDQLSNPNLLMNGNFRNPVNQRGAVTQNQNCFVCDRYNTVYINRNNTFNCTFDNNGMKLIMASNRSYRALELIYPVESDIIIPLRGKKITLSVKVHEVSNLEKINPYLNYFFSSNKDSNRACEIDRITNEDIVYLNANSGILSFTITVPDNASMMSIRFGLMCMNELNSDNVYEVNGEYGVFEWIKLEVGDKATPFVPRPYGEELQLCKRYYEVGAWRGVSLRAFDTKDFIQNFIKYDVQKRVEPTIKILSNLDKTDGCLQDATNNENTSVGVWISGLGGFTLKSTNLVKDHLYIGTYIADAEIY